ncbi:MAG TPA: hypothetical protein VGL56_01350 [Fimbriimonadaceae bacterium]
MRKIFLGVVFGLSAAAFAQTDDVVKIQAAYQNMREFPAVQIQVDSIRQNNQKQTNSSEIIDWVWDPTEQTANSAKMAAADYVNGVQVAQLVADGETLFNYYPTQRSYLAHYYAATTNTAQSDYRMNLLQHFDSFSGLRGNYAARFLQEAYGADASIYSPWSSGEMTEINTTTGPAIDPITGTSYTPSAVMDYVTYEVTGTVNRSIVLQRTSTALPDGTEGYVITAIYVAEADNTDTSNPKNLQVILSITPQVTAPTNTTFTFVPPSGSKALQSTGVVG